MAYRYFVTVGKAQQHPVIASYEMPDVTRRYPIRSMYLHTPIAECGNRVSQPHQDDDGTGDGDHFKVVPGHVYVYDILPHRFRQALQQPLRFNRADVQRGLSRLVALDCVVAVALRICIRLRCVY